MTFEELDKLPVAQPLRGIEVKRSCGDFGQAKQFLRSLLRARALVCVSPLRSERCDQPATGIFFQDGMEWYPCCDAHWPGGPEWTGNTRFSGMRVAALAFAERVTPEILVPGDTTEEYDRSDAA